MSNASASAKEQRFELDDAALHGLAGQFVRALAPHTEAHPVALLEHLLAEFSCAISRRPYIVLDGHQTPLIIWPCIVGERSKARKDTADRRIDGIFPKAGIHLQRGGKCIGTLLTGDVLIAALCNNPPKGVEIHRDPCLYLVQSQFGSVLQTIDGEQNSLASVLRMAWDGKTIVPPPPLSDRISAAEPHLVVVGHVTPDQASKYLNTTNKCRSIGDLFLWLSVERGQMLAQTSSPSDATMKPLYEALRNTVGFVHGTPGEPMTFPNSSSPYLEVTLSPEAAQCWEEVYPILSTSRPGQIGALLCRAEAYVLRIAALYALLDMRTCVDVPHLEAALALWNYAEESVERLFGNNLSVAECEHRILRAIEKAGRMTDDEVSALFEPDVPVDTLRSAKTNLEREGLIQCQEGKAEGCLRVEWLVGPGKPTRH